MAMQLADEQGVDLILANDPDGDRLAVAVRSRDGAWHPLTGDAIGVLLADDLLTHGPKSPPRCVASSIVSTSMLDAIARAHDAERLVTLTGFKWIARAGLQAESEGKRYVLGFEEAIGYNVGLKVRDKDGVTAALLVADLAARLAHQNRSLLDQLEGLYQTHGYYLTTQRSFQREGAKGKVVLQEALHRLRTQVWDQMAEVPVLWVRDLKAQTRFSPGQPTTQDTRLPVADVLEVGLTDSSRVLIRPSGTEPKLKIYAEVRQPWPPDEPAQDVRRAAATRATRLLDALTERLGLEEGSGVE
jgi:phosphomannomutase